MFPRLSSPAALEDEVLAYWKQHRVFETAVSRPAEKSWVFYEGPPTANGTPHNGHVLTRVMKDVFPRYKTMCGYHVSRKAGWDTHGLPVEVEVEKQLDVHGKEAIEAYGLDKFSKACIDNVFTYTQEWNELTTQIGFWVDLDDPYVTYHRPFVESVWWALSRLFEKGLLYQGHKVVWWWPQGGTTLSAAEVGLGYKDVDDPAVTVRFRDASDPSVSYLAWTTTPWTLPSNVALAVNANVTYAVCDDPAGGEVILAASAAEAYGLTVKRTIVGADLVGRTYTPLYDFGPVENGRSFEIVAGDHVTEGSGTGLVHTAPAFGEDDMDVARKHGLGILQWIEPNGRFPAHTPWAGRFCKEADPDIIRDLKDRGLLFKRDQIRHSYPFCWRADSDPLIQYARPAWFIRTTREIQQALANNDAVTWHPEHIQQGRFGDFLRNNVDWALSRERFWGTPLPIWHCPSCGTQECLPSVEALKARGAVGFDETVDVHLQVHRPWIDRVTLPCTACGGTMGRVPEVIDCWFDSGCMPFAQWGFPHQGVEAFKQHFPADFICEAIDQTRGWFYSLMMISTLLFDDETCQEFGLDPVGLPRPYKNCVVLGHVCDRRGIKESKSKGNYTSPNLVLRGWGKLQVLTDATLQPGTVGLKPAQVESLEVGDEPVTLRGPAGEIKARVVSAKVDRKDAVNLHPDDIAGLGLAHGDTLQFGIPGEPPGADAFRWLFCASSPPWSNTRLSMRAIREGQREFLIRLRNVYQFYAIYANIGVEQGTFDPKGQAPRPVAARAGLDRWIVHQLDVTLETVTRELDNYRLYEASRALLAFVDDLSNWYVRRSRSRFWGEGPDLEDALWTLYEVLATFAKMIAPFVPFTAESLHLALGGHESVHLAAWPSTDPARRDDALAAEMSLVREVVSLGLSARTASKIKVRQPLSRATVVLADPSRRAAIEPHAEVMCDELNVREIHFAEDDSAFVTRSYKPDFKKLGKKLGGSMKAVQAWLGANAGAVAAALKADHMVTIPVEGGSLEILEDEILAVVEPKGDFQAASSQAAVVALATAIDEDLRREGFVRELVSKVQGLRKELDFGFTDRIALGFDADTLAELAQTDGLRGGVSYLMAETLCPDRPGALVGEGTLADVDGRLVRIEVRPRS